MQGRERDIIDIDDDDDDGIWNVLVFNTLS